MIYPQTVRAVNPIALAEVSGATKIRRFSAPTPPVPRPFLLTNQLRGCCDACKTTGMGLPPDYGTLRAYNFAGSGDPGLRAYNFNGSGDPGLRGVVDAISGDPSTFNMANLQVPSAGSGNISVLQTLAVGANFIPGVGQVGSLVLSSFNQFLNQFEAWFHIGAGRREANIIVPVQNNLVNVTLNQITQQILTGMTPSVEQLDALYRQVWSSGVAFQEFVLMRNFTDRRASGQALNTIMPYIDGTCGYSVPVGYTAAPGSWNCLTWGDGTLGGPGTNGMLGAIARAITNAGGTPPTLPDLHQSANSGIHPSQITTNPTGLWAGLPPTIMGVSTPLALAIGVGALFLYKRGSF